MTVSLEDPMTHEPIELADEPLFRGGVLTTYANRKWTRPATELRGAPVEAQTSPPGVPLVRQRFVVRPLDTPALFSLYPAFSAISYPDMVWSPDREQVRRTRRSNGRIMEYELFTTGVIDRRMASIVPALRSLNDDTLLKLPLNLDGSDPLAATAGLAERIVRGIPADNYVERVRMLTNYLRDPTNFRYTLDGVARDPQLDPIEDFLTQHRIGHCEYFASALAIMLARCRYPFAACHRLQGRGLDGGPLPGPRSARSRLGRSLFAAGPPARSVARIF